MMEIQTWSIDRPKDYPLNARKWSPKAIAKVAASLKQYGWRQPIVVDEADVIVIGHLRRTAARSIGIAECPVHVVRDLSPEQIRGLRLADNRTNEEATWDNGLLAAEFQQLRAMDFNLSATGFDIGEITRLLPTAEVDDIPETPSSPVTARGDLWLLGEHRLLCGDATERDAVLRLMGGGLAGLMNTDPPYGVGYANEERPNPGVAKPRVAKPRVANDTLQDEVLQGFLESAFTAAISALKPNAAWYLWHAHLTQGFFAAAAAAAHVILHRQIIWVKPVLLLGRGQYHWKHEPCFMGWVEGNQPPDYAERNQTTVWEIASVNSSDRKEFDHSTPKPVGLFEIPISKHLNEGEICYDPFAGSGPQFIAAEQLNRRCYGLEIEPKYCDVIVERWQKLTGRTATLEGDGRTFSTILAERKESLA